VLSNFIYSLATNQMLTAEAMQKFGFMIK